MFFDIGTRGILQTSNEPLFFMRERFRHPSTPETSSFFSEEEIEEAARQDLDRQDMDSSHGRPGGRLILDQHGILTRLSHVPESDRRAIIERIEAAKIRIHQERKQKQIAESQRAWLKGYYPAYEAHQHPGPLTDSWKVEQLEMDPLFLVKIAELKRDPHLMDLVARQYEQEKEFISEQQRLHEVMGRKEREESSIVQLSSQISSLIERAGADEEHLLELARMLRAQLSEIRDILRKNGSL